MARPSAARTARRRRRTERGRLDRHLARKRRGQANQDPALRHLSGGSNKGSERQLMNARIGGGSGRRYPKGHRLWRGVVGAVKPIKTAFPVKQEQPHGKRSRRRSRGRYRR